MPNRDPILDELHAIRERMLEEADGDLERLAREANEAAEKLGVALERLPPKRLPPQEPKAKKKAS